MIVLNCGTYDLLHPGHLYVFRQLRSLVGFDGIVFVDDLLEQNQLQVGEGDGACTVRFAYVRPASGGLPVIGPLRCAAAAASAGAGR